MLLYNLLNNGSGSCFFVVVVVEVNQICSD